MTLHITIALHVGLYLMKCFAAILKKYLFSIGYVMVWTAFVKLKRRCFNALCNDYYYHSWGGN